MSARDRAATAFRHYFGMAPAMVVRAPGRVNLIGEHTDYNGGFVLPIAIDRELCIALRPRADRRVVVHSLDYQEVGDFDFDALSRAGAGWLEYIKGVAWSLQQNGHATAGWEGVICGDIPRGAGLSSSAAVELAALYTFAALGNLTLTAVEAARLAQQVENGWLGVNSGLMDPLVIAAGRQDHALLIDCATQSFAAVPLPADLAVVVLDTGTRRELLESSYNERRAECQAAARALGVATLRDLDPETFDARKAALDPIALRRARHVVSENQRTLEAAAALRLVDLPRLGQLMNASHASLDVDFEVTTPALNTMVELARQQPDCLGARMTGAGFGGCAVALVRASNAHAFSREVCARYQQATGLEPEAYRCRAADGIARTSTLLCEIGSPDLRDQEER